MLLKISSINWFALVIAFVAYFGLGAVWFTLLFKRQYLKSLGKENAARQKPEPIFIAGPALCTLVITLCNAIMLQALNVVTIGAALEFSMIVGFGYLFANTVNIAINPNMPRPIFYGIISGSYHLVGMIICCIILVTLR